MPVTIRSLLERKRRGERFAMLTAYDYTTARILAEAEIPVLLVGDSLGMVMLGYRNTLPVTMEEMLHHARAVARGAPDQLLVGDMPFNSYHASDEQAIANAASFVLPISNPANLGLTPQFFNLLGGFRVQGREAEVAARIESDARELEAAGAFAVVLEGMPGPLAASVTASLTIPTIGIGAGPGCDGQVLVFHDILGLNRDPLPKFVKVFAPLGDEAVAATRAYAAEVAAGTFPDDAHTYS